MATKADFTKEEWEAMQEGITGAGMFVAISDPGFWDTFKEASALAKHVNEAHTKNESALVRELAQGHDKPFGATASAAEAEKATVKRCTPPSRRSRRSRPRIFPPTSRSCSTSRSRLPRRRRTSRRKRAPRSTRFAPRSGRRSDKPSAPEP